MRYDVIVIGAGPGGYNAALRASKSGLKVLIAEKDKVGGVCLNEGCIPTKTLLYSAKLLDGIKNGEKYGVLAHEPVIDQNKVVDRKNKVVRTLVSGIKNALKNAGADIVNGEARISKSADGSLRVSIGETGYESDNVIIATGSTAILPGIKGLRDAYDNGFALTSKEMLDVREIPKRLIVVGGGVIGLEMASYFNSVGSEVCVIEMQSKIGGTLDTEIAGILQKNYEKKGMSFLLGATLTEVRENSVLYQQNDSVSEIFADSVLVSIGRAPNCAGLGIEELGLEMNGRAVNTDECMRTNVKGLYAIGDVNGRLMLAHTAYREGEVCINNILGKPDAIDYGIIPSVIYTNPEAASVGETAESAREKGYDAEEHTVSMRFSGRYIAENEGGDGICKLVIDKKTNTLLGVHMLANYSSEIIYGAAILIRNRTVIDDIKKIVFPHPSVAEIIREGIFEL